MQTASEECKSLPRSRMRDRSAARFHHREQRPVLMTVGKNGDTQSSFAHVLPLESLLANKYTFAMEKGRHRDFNVYLIKGSFLQMNTMGFQVHANGPAAHPAACVCGVGKGNGPSSNARPCRVGLAPPTPVPSGIGTSRAPLPARAECHPSDGAATGRSTPLACHQALRYARRRSSTIS